MTKILTGLSERSYILLCLALSFVIFLCDIQIPLGVAAGVPYVVVILCSLFIKSIRPPILFAIICSLLLLLGFFLSPAGGELWKVIFNRLLALFVIWTTAVLGLQRRLLWEQKEDAVKEIKILKGLLPICASCKRIRDDNGYWNQIESYIGDNSEAEFSHGICPECCARLYPDIDFSNSSQNIENRDSPEKH